MREFWAYVAWTLPLSIIGAYVSHVLYNAWRTWSRTRRAPTMKYYIVMKDKKDPPT